MTIQLETPATPVLAEGEVKPEPATVVLFSIDNTDYRVPANPSASILLKFLWRSKYDELGAVRDMLTSLLGDEGFLALSNYEPLTSDQFKAVVEAATKVLTGDGPKG